MDEPLGALDRRLRESLQLEIRRLHQELGITVVYVTHDQEEALVLSDRIALFNGGRIVQLGTSSDLYRRPASVFAATFIGDANVIPGELKIEGGNVWIAAGALRVRCPFASAATEANGRSGTLVVRPEHVLVTRAGAKLPNADSLLGSIARPSSWART